MDERSRQEEEKKFQEEQKKHQDHPALHHPVREKLVNLKANFSAVRGEEALCGLSTVGFASRENVCLLFCPFQMPVLDIEKV